LLEEDIETKADDLAASCQGSPILIRMNNETIFTLGECDWTESVGVFSKSGSGDLPSPISSVSISRIHTDEEVLST
jgi:hypothetical protein